MIRVAAVPRHVDSIGNVRVVVDRVTTEPNAEVPLHGYTFTFPAAASQKAVERVSLPLAVPAPDGTLTTGVTPEVLIAAALDAYQTRAAVGMADDVTQRARLANVIGMLRAALVEIEAYVGGADGRAPLEAPPYTAN